MEYTKIYIYDNIIIHHMYIYIHICIYYIRWLDLVERLGFPTHGRRRRRESRWISGRPKCSTKHPGNRMTADDTSVDFVIGWNKMVWFVGINNTNNNVYLYIILSYCISVYLTYSNPSSPLQGPPQQKRHPSLHLVLSTRLTTSFQWVVPVTFSDASS